MRSRRFLARPALTCIAHAHDSRCRSVAFHAPFLAACAGIAVVIDRNMAQFLRPAADAPLYIRHWPRCAAEACSKDQADDIVKPFPAPNRHFRQGHCQCVVGYHYREAGLFRGSASQFRSLPSREGFCAPPMIIPFSLTEPASRFQCLRHFSSSVFINKRRGSKKEHCRGPFSPPFPLPWAWPLRKRRGRLWKRQRP